MKDCINFLIIGDIVGKPGRTVLKNRLQGLKDLYRVDFVIANGENTSGGSSITSEKYSELKGMGIDVVTTGNHIWDKKEAVALVKKESDLIIPANYPPGTPGAGWVIKDFAGLKICTINLLGRLFLQAVDCPFRKFDEIYDRVSEESDIIIVDFHAEATSEKRAFGWYADGRASLVFGTHTHVQTADEEILPGGTGYITDVGMTGAFDSVIGFNRQYAVQKFLTQLNVKRDVATKNPGINAILAKISGRGRTEEIKRIAV